MVAGVCGCFVGCVWAEVVVGLDWGGRGGPVIEEGEGVLPVMGSGGLCVYLLFVCVRIGEVLC